MPKLVLLSFQFHRATFFELPCLASGRSTPCRRIHAAFRAAVLRANLGDFSYPIQAFPRFSRLRVGAPRHHFDQEQGVIVLRPIIRGINENSRAHGAGASVDPCV